MLVSKFIHTLTPSVVHSALPSLYIHPQHFSSQRQLGIPRETAEKAFLTQSIVFPSLLWSILHNRNKEIPPPPSSIIFSILKLRTHTRTPYTRQCAFCSSCIQSWTITLKLLPHIIYQIHFQILVDSTKLYYIYTYSVSNL